MKSVRTRFAPSPTGFLHVGGVRTALFAWLVAKQHEGQFLLRIEDTDKAREVSGADKHIIDSLKALDLDFDGEPYYQSQHLDAYKQWAKKLIDSDRAYTDPYTPDQVQEFRDQAQAAKQPFLYRNHRPEKSPAWDGTKPLRFKSEPKAYTWHDAVMGDISTGPEVIDDFILIKSDGYPTYNFAHVVDDAQMKISHVIRGQEFLASVPNYINLYEALDLTPPIMATVPHILGPDGKKKLSKRDGAKDVLDYIREGYLPEALISFIATLGWNDGTEQEVFTRDELILKFSLDRIQKSGAKFDEQRLKWINGYFIRQLPLDEIYQLSHDFWPAEAKSASADYKKAVLRLVQERLKYLSELPGLTKFFFTDLPEDPKLISKHKLLGKLGSKELSSMLDQTVISLKDSDFSEQDLSNRLNELLSKTGQKPAVLFSLVRVATSWYPGTPELAATLAVLGKAKSLERLNRALDGLRHDLLS